MTRRSIPKVGQSKDQVIAAMQAARERDVNWRHGKAFSLVFQAGEEVNAVIREAYVMFMSENGLNPAAFPSLRKFETEVVAMSASLLGGDDEVAGNMTSGGTESIMMAVKTARQWAHSHRPEIEHPEIVIPVSAHPAFEKAAEYFHVKARKIPVSEDYRADPLAMAAAVNRNTVLLVGSAPSYPQGVVDPIPELAKIAQESRVHLHVDACVGGYMLPFVRRLGYPVTPFDFSVPGVTSISADLHKYGYAAKGASVILYRNRSLRRHQYFANTDWAGGIYASPTMTGTRPGGAIAAAWAVMNFLGEDGYMEIADVVMRTSKRIRQGIEAIRGLCILGEPEMSVMAIGSDRLNIYDVGDEMTARGWHLDRQQFPASLHLTIHYGHSLTAENFLQDLKEAVAVAGRVTPRRLRDAWLLKLANTILRILPDKLVSSLTSHFASLIGAGSAELPQRSAAMYGLMGSLPNRGDLRELVLDLLDNLTSLESDK